MICEKCGQREANVRLTEIVNGNVTEHNLCMECAGGPSLNGYGSIFSGESQLGRLLTGLLGFAANQAKQDQGVDTSSIICPVCRTSYDDFAENSRFGCPDCYEVFELLMNEHIKTIQGAEKHTGKMPMRYRAKAERMQANQTDLRKIQKDEEPLHSTGPLQNSLPQNVSGVENSAVCEPASLNPMTDNSANNKTFSLSLEERIDILKAQLKEALREEDYEIAASLRDQIRSLQAEVTADE